MRPPSVPTALFALAVVVATLAGCGTKTPLKLPPPAQSAATGTAASGAAAEPGR